MQIPRKQVLAIVAAVVVAGPAMAAEQPKGFVTWLNDYLVSRVRVAAGTRSNANQAEAPNLSGNSTSLVDTSSASDLVGIALNVAGLSKNTNNADDHNDATTATATTSAYVLWAAATGKNPLDPAVYCGASALGPARYWRRVSFTLGLDNQQHAASGQNDPIIAGAKAILWTERDVCDADFNDVQSALERATTRVAVISKRIEDDLYARYQAGAFVNLPRRMDEIDFLNAIRKGDAFAAVLQEVGESAIGNLVTTEDLRDLVNLDQVTRGAIDRFRGQPQLSANFTTKQRSAGVDEYRAQMVFDYGLNQRLALTANASFDDNEGDDVESTKHGKGGRVAAGVQFEPFPDPLFGPKTVRISLNGEGKWAERAAPTYKGQLKVNLPIPKVQWLTGLELPLSITIANRSDLVDEADVVGRIGFTLDTSHLLAAMQ